MPLTELKSSENTPVLLIGTAETPSALRLRSEAVRMGMTLDFLSPRQLLWREGEVDIEGDSNLSRNFLDYETYFFRGMSDQAKHLQSIAKFLVTKGKRIVEKRFPELGMPEDKVVPESRLGYYRLPESALVAVPVSEEICSSFKFPCVVKKIGFGSSRGRQVKKVNSTEEIKVFSTEAHHLILQKYYPIEFDTRVLIVGGECIGGYNRYKPEGEDFLTTRKGGKREVVKLSENQIQAALEATKLQGLEIAGVDMFMFEGEIYVLEVNSSPQFNVFERKTGVNVAQKILRYITE